MATFRRDNLICVRNGMIFWSSEVIAYCDIIWHHFLDVFSIAAKHPETRHAGQLSDQNGGHVHGSSVGNLDLDGVIVRDPGWYNTTMPQWWNNTLRLRPNVFHEILAEAKEAAFIDWILLFYGKCEDGVCVSMCCSLLGRQPWLVKKAWQSSISTCPSGFLNISHLSLLPQPSQVLWPWVEAFWKSQKDQAN